MNETVIHVGHHAVHINAARDIVAHAAHVDLHRRRRILIDHLLLRRLAQIFQILLRDLHSVLDGARIVRRLLARLAKVTRWVKRCAARRSIARRVRRQPIGKPRQVHICAEVVRLPCVIRRIAVGKRVDVKCGVCNLLALKCRCFHVVKDANLVHAGDHVNHVDNPVDRRADILRHAVPNIDKEVIDRPKRILKHTAKEVGKRDEDVRLHLDEIRDLREEPREHGKDDARRRYARTCKIIDRRDCRIEHYNNRHDNPENPRQRTRI